MILVTMLIQLIICAIYSAASTAANTGYRGFKVYEVYPENHEQIDTIASYHENEFFDFWFTSRFLNTPTTVMVHPKMQPQFIHSLKEANISHNVFIEDVARFLKKERRNRKSDEKVEDGNISFTAYNRYPTIEKYIKRLAKDYPDIVTLESVGKTYEKRDLWLIKIGKEDKNKPIILIDGGIHAREWISPAAVLYTIQSLVENKNNRNLIENVNWYIIPVLNPDGYDYSHNHRRLWRKNRAPTGNPICPGVDLNRNFGYKWVSGTSSCRCTYPGKNPSDQLETKILQKIVQEYRKRIKLYISFHSAASMILLPWAYTTTTLPENHIELHRLGMQVRDAIFSVRGTKYNVGSPGQLLPQTASGSSMDWIKGIGRVELSYAVELYGRQLADFFLPEYMILGVCIETFEGTKAFHNYVEKKFVAKT